MLPRFLSRLTILPRWVIIIIDLLVILVATALGFLLRFNFDLPDILRFKPVNGFILTIISGLATTIVTKSYAGIVRYTGIEDGVRIMYATILSLVLSVLVNLLYYYNTGHNLIPYSVLFITFFTSYLLLFYYRLLVKTIFAYYKGETTKRANVAIFGAGSLGMITRSVLETDTDSQFKVVAFFEDDPNKTGKVINGVKIFPWSDFDMVVERNRIKELIIAVKDIKLDRKNEIVEECLSRHLKTRIVPPAEKWVKGEFRIQQLKEVNIDDLLGRDVIRLEEDSLFRTLANKRVLVTGAAGSIGSELARQAVLYHPQVVILIDQAESPLYALERELRELMPDVKLEVYVADITNEERIAQLFKASQAHLVFHAAAYKHVPMMESNPAEAIFTNIIGTKILADLAVECGIEKFVMISTDKAVNPTSVMGCSKRIAEIYVQSLFQHLESKGGHNTQFITTRFGNVLGSNGSVIPTFRQQISSGGPVTVTHPDVTRYFMTIPEACRLVLEAGAMGTGGEIFIFDMGKPVRIIDLAKKMIRLSGLEPSKDIDIVFTGLREGEKLYEELLNQQENTLPTHHEKILIAKVSEHDYSYINSMISLFIDLLHDKNELKMVALMKEIVPDFRSNYSRFEILDKMD
ncbi:MAG: polysaccharide biosynthesis protein [Cyclobacteriaceae bacterium]|nr:polysaccharide biosynthesis protein [Cyclobacteriaceae bacterium]